MRQAYSDDDATAFHVTILAVESPSWPGRVLRPIVGRPDHTAYSALFQLNHAAGLDIED